VATGAVADTASQANQLQMQFKMNSHYTEMYWMGGFIVPNITNAA